MADEVLVAKDIVKSFGRVRVLRDVSLTVRKGERYVLFGSNGAGKTTLVKILSTLIAPDSGELLLFGGHIEEREMDVRARIGFLSHSPFLNGDLSAWENLDFYAQLYSVEGRKARVKAMLKKVGLYHRAYDRVATFSSGMKQRLGLARAILHDPDLIFLDEPFSGLDIRAQDMLNGLIVQLSEEGKTFFSITHDPAKGFEVATRAAVLSGGKIAYESEADDIEAFSERYKGILEEERL
jgi:ABC-type multidrug transport system ATPase subunit